MNLGNETTFDAIVVGTGISGGWAAKELTEKGVVCKLSHPISSKNAP